MADVYFQNALLQETSEEWEQCEKKMKDVRHWIDKTKQTLESPQNKKKTLRDQLALREKIIGDVSIQKTKISMSVDKLNVSGVLHFFTAFFSRTLLYVFLFFCRVSYRFTSVRASEETSASNRRLRVW